MTARLWLLAGIVALAGFIYMTLPARAQGPVDAAIVFVVDVSDTMDFREMRDAREAHANALVSEQVLTAIGSGITQSIAIAYVEFGSKADVAVGWQRIASKADAAAVADRILALEAGPKSRLGYTTSVGEGLWMAQKVMQSAPPAQRRIVDVVGDGRSNHGRGVTLARKALLEAGVTINGLPLLTGEPGAGLERYFAEDIVGGPLSFSFPLTHIDQLETALRQKIVLELF